MLECTCWKFGCPQFWNTARLCWGDMLKSEVRIPFLRWWSVALCCLKADAPPSSDPYSRIRCPSAATSVCLHLASTAEAPFPPVAMWCIATGSWSCSAASEVSVSVPLVGGESVKINNMVDIHHLNVCSGSTTPRCSGATVASEGMLYSSQL